MINPEVSNQTAPPPSNSFPPVAVAYSAPPPQKVRRVGTFTTGLVLIAGGCLLLLAIFLPEKNFLWFLRFSPLVLVSLGVEVLLYNIRYKDAILKYDFISVLLALFLIFISSVGSFSAFVVDRYGDLGSSYSTLNRDLQASAYEALKDNSSVKDVDAYVSFDWWVADKSPTPKTLGKQYTTHYSVTMKNQYDTPADFAASCHSVLTALKGSVSHIDSISFSVFRENDSEDNAPLYSMHLSGLFETNIQNINELSDLVVTSLPEDDSLAQQLDVSPEEEGLDEEISPEVSSIPLD